MFSGKTIFMFLKIPQSTRKVKMKSANQSFIVYYEVWFRIQDWLNIKSTDEEHCVAQGQKSRENT